MTTFGIPNPKPKEVSSFKAEKPRKYYVSMTDKFLSGWGRAEGKTNKFVVECDTYEEAEAIRRNAEKRSEMKYINVSSSKPYYNSRRFLVSERKYADLGDIWKK